MHKKNRFQTLLYLQQSKRYTSIVKQARNQGGLFPKTPIFVLQFQCQRQAVLLFSVSNSSGNFDTMGIPENLNLVSVFGFACEAQEGTFTPPKSPKLLRIIGDPNSNSFWKKTDSSDQAFHVFSNSSISSRTEKLPEENNAGWVSEIQRPPEIIEQKVSNLHSRNILRFIFTVITGGGQGSTYDNAGKTLLVASSLSLDSVPLNQELSLRFITNIIVAILIKSKKAFWTSASTRNFTKNSLIVFTVIGFPVLLGFTMRLTTSYTIKSSTSTTTAGKSSLSEMGYPSCYTSDGLLDKKSHLFNGLISSLAELVIRDSVLRNESTDGYTVGLPILSQMLANSPKKVEALTLAPLSLESNISSFDTSLLSLGSSLEPVRENMLRLPEYLSKLFIIWGLLYIWKGVRPQRKTLKDFHGEGIARVIWPNRPSGGLRRFTSDSVVLRLKKLRGGAATKGAFSSLQGLTAFLPVLETLIQSLQIRNSKWTPISQSPKIANLQGRHPKGYLFVGPPGTGKTLLAQALASEAQVPLLCLSASEIQKQIEIGTRIGALRLRKLFEQARRLAPCILFMDEIDAIGKYRGGANLGGAPALENFSQNTEASGSSQSTNSGAGKSSDLKLFTEFLIQMDECKGPGTPDGFVVIGTTNFLSNLDSAFIRSGRFDRILGLNYPSKKVRIDILKWYCGTSAKSEATSKMDAESSAGLLPWNYFGHYTNQYSPADLARLVNESLLYQVTNGKILVQRSSIRGGVANKPLHTFESLQKGFNRIQSHKRNLSGEGNTPPPLLIRNTKGWVCSDLITGSWGEKLMLFTPNRKRVLLSLT